MSWNEYIRSTKQGRQPDMEFELAKIASPAPPVIKRDTLFRSVAVSPLASLQKLAAEQEAVDWLEKRAFIDASQMQGGDMGGGMPPQGGGDPMMGGGMPPGGDPMMGGGAPPMDPSMMGGGMPPGMDPSMMGGGMPPGMPPCGGMGGMPPPMPGMDPTMNPQGKKMKIEEIVMKETARIKELLHGLYTAMGIEIPLSVVDSKDMAAAILEREEKKRTEQQVQDTIPGTNTMPIPPLNTKIGGIGATATRNKVSAIVKALSKR